MNIVLKSAAAVLLMANASQAALISSAADAALAGATVEDLNATATGNFTTATVGDLTFTGISGDLRFAPFDEGGDFGGDGQNLSTVSLGGEFRIDFAQEVSAFASIWGAANQDWTVSAFDAANALIDSQTFIAGPPYDAYFGIAAADISYAIFSGGGGDWVLLDDFSYVSSGVVITPLPAAGLLLLGAMGALGLSRKKST